MPQGLNLRQAGLLAAAATALLGGGLVAIVALGSKPGRPTTPELPSGTLPPAPDDPGVSTDITDIAVAGSRGSRLQFVDRKDPTRIAGELHYTRLDPLGAGRCAVEAPRVWVYLADGRALHVQAAQGNIYIPAKSKDPESGRFTGGVLARLFNPVQGRTINADTDAPVLVATADTMDFDTLKGEISTPDPVLVSTPEIEFACVSIRVVANQVQDRIELIHTPQGRYIRYSPPARGRPIASASATPIQAPAAVSAPSTSADASEAPSTATPDPFAAASPRIPAPAPGSAQPDETLYRAVFESTVRLAQRSRTLTCDRLDAWTRLVDNQLPGDALPALSPSSAPAALGFAPDTPALAHAAPRPTSGLNPLVSPAATLASLALAAQPQSSNPASLTRTSDDDVTLTWTGPLTLTPIEPGAPELSSDHVYFRFVSDAALGVHLDDPSAKAHARCATLDYAATTRRFFLAGSEPHHGGTLAPAQPIAAAAAVEATQWPVVLWLEDAGRLDARSLEIDTQSSRVLVSSAGVLTAAPSSESSFPSPADSPSAALDSPADPHQPSLALPSSPSPAPARSIRWHESAEFLLSPTPDFLGPPLRSAAFTSGVVASDATASVGGSFLSATFTTSADDTTSHLSRIIVQGDARAETGVPVASSSDIPAGGEADPGPSAQPPAEPLAARGGSLAADTIDLTFAPRTSDESSTDPWAADAEPTLLVADGNVRASQDDSSLHADFLSAELHRPDSPDSPTAPSAVAVRSAHAEGQVRFDRDRDALGATADSLDADLAAQTVTLLADSPARPASISRDGASIRAGQMVLDAARKRLDVFGSGVLSVPSSPPAAEPPAASGPAPQEALRAAWATSLVFDDSLGTAELVGSATAVHTPDESTVQTVRAHRIALTFTPGATGAEGTLADSTASDASSPATAARLLTAEATGESLESPGGSPASVEIRQFAPDAAPAASESQRPIETLVFLQGDRILADEARGELLVPTPGKLLIDDRRIKSPDETRTAFDSPVGTPGSSPRGASLFAWTGSFRMDRSRGSVHMLDNVRLFHRPADDQPDVLLDAQRIDAEFASDRVGDAPADASMTPVGGAAASFSRLVKVTAQSDVVVVSDSRTLRSDLLTHDAVARTIVADSMTQEPRVTFTDAQGMPTSARRLYWNLATGRITLSEPAPVVLPR